MNFKSGEQLDKISDYNDIITTIIAIIGVAALVNEFYGNDRLNESRFIMELNNDFISNRELMEVECDLMRYFVAYAGGEALSQVRDEFRKPYAFNQYERQKLINYLVYLEGIATIFEQGVLKFEHVDNLMSYRFFIAVNNPDVQDMELWPYKSYYNGIYSIYQDWVDSVKRKQKKMKKNNKRNRVVDNSNKDDIGIAMMETPLIPQK